MRLKPLYFRIDAILKEIGYGRDFGAGEHSYAAERGAASYADAHARYTNLLHRLKREALHRSSAWREHLKIIAYTPGRHS
jgi:hypothetical protein